MNMKKIFLVIMILLTPFSLSACGFRMLGSWNPAPNRVNYGRNTSNPAISGIYIKPFKNLTYKSGLGAYFSMNLSDYLNAHTSMFSSNENEAQYYLEGKILNIQNNVISYTGVAAAVNYIISATVKVSLYSTGGRIIFRDATFTSSATYFNYINPLTAHKQVKTALKTVSKRIARKIAIYIESRGIIAGK